MSTIILNAILFLVNFVIFILTLTIPRMMSNTFLIIWSLVISIFCGIYTIYKIKEYK